MTKRELAKILADTRGFDVTVKDAELLLDVAFDEIARSLRRDRRFAYPGFGTFTVRTRKARMGVNPQTKRPIKIPAARYVRFKNAPSLKRGL